MAIDFDGRFRYRPPVRPRMTDPTTPNYDPMIEPDPYTPPLKLDPDGNDFDWAYYKQVCNEQAPKNKGFDKCQMARWLLGRAKACVGLRGLWRHDYGPRDHDNELVSRLKELLNAEDKVKNECKPGQLASFSMSPIPSTSPMCD